MADIGKKRLAELLQSKGEIGHWGLYAAVSVRAAKLDNATKEEYVLLVPDAGSGSTWARVRDVRWSTGG